MRRMTETMKWEDEWFFSLSKDEKMLFLYMCDKCDACGVWSPNWTYLTRMLEIRVDAQSFIDRSGGRIVRLPNGKLLLTRFMPIQYGDALLRNDTSNVHKGVLKCLVANGLVYREQADTGVRVSEALANPCPTLSQPLAKGCPTLQDKDQNKDQYQDKDQSLVRGSAEGGVVEVELALEAPTAAPAKRPNPLEAAFEAFWDSYPTVRKDAKGNARKAYAKACSTHSPETINTAVAEYRRCFDLWRADDQKFNPLPATWLNGERFLDDPEGWRRKCVDRTTYDDSEATH